MTDDAWLDPDDDGYTNYDEFIGDSDPNDSEDTPRHVLEDFESGDLTKFYWILSGDAPWSASQDNPYRDFFSALSPVLYDSQSAGMETTINCIQGFVAFRYSVASEADGDWLRFYIDDVLQQEWSGDQPYQFAAFPVAPGIHTFKWEYAKNGSEAQFEDCAWIDNISFPGSGDRDNDGVLDGWEYVHFYTFDQDLCFDTDDDGLLDLQEALLLLDPLAPQPDSDADGMDDGWELWHFGSLDAADDATDSDGDGLLDTDEYWYLTDPFDWDTDDDGYSDGLEVQWNSDPKDKEDFPNIECEGDFDDDSDIDGSDFFSFVTAFGTSPADPYFDPKADFDDNGIVNGDDLSIIALDLGRTDCSAPQAPVYFDSDGDTYESGGSGLLVTDEYAYLADPFDRDTDDDGYSDGLEDQWNSDPEDKEDFPNIECEGNFDDDNDVDRSDFLHFAAAFGTSLADPYYDPKADFDDNGIVNGDDLFIIVLYLGRTDCSAPQVPVYFDSDGDIYESGGGGLLDTDEYTYLTEPFDWDTDDDGYSVGIEDLWNDDPIIKEAFPNIECEGNFDDDNDVDRSDFLHFVAAFEASATDPYYDPKADFDQNGVINVDDLFIIVLHLGRIDCSAIPIPVDIDNDGDVDEDDLYLFEGTLGSCEGEPEFDPRIDYDGDGCVTNTDYVIWLNFYNG